jgi:hypothetical protein
VSSCLLEKSNTGTKEKKTEREKIRTTRDRKERRNIYIYTIRKEGEKSMHVYGNVNWKVTG